MQYHPVIKHIAEVQLVWDQYPSRTLKTNVLGVLLNKQYYVYSNLRIVTDIIWTGVSISFICVYSYLPAVC